MRNKRNILIIIVLLAAFAHGLVTHWHSRQMWSSSRQEWRGYIDSLPVERGLAQRFLFHTPEGLMRVSWYRCQRVLKPGQGWRLVLKSHPVTGLHNFNQSRLVLSQYTGIRAEAYVKQAAQSTIDDHLTLIDTWRWYIRRWLLSHTSASHVQGILLALLIGDKSHISNTAWQILQRTGTSHLVAISGLHIGLVATGMYIIVRYLWALVPRLALRLAAQRAGWISAWLAAVMYSALAGFAVPTQRALIMIGLLAYGKVMNQKITALRAWSYALILIALWNPWSFLLPGTYLSFVAVGALLYAFSHRVGRGSAWQRFIKPQWVASLALFPWILFFFGQITFLDIVINSIAIPAVSFILVPALILAWLSSPMPEVSQLLLTVAEKAGGYLWAFLTYCAKLPIWGMYWPTPHWPALVWALLGSLLLLAPVAIPGRALGWVLMLPLYAWQMPWPNMGEAKLWVLDVGQGLAVMVQTHQHVLVYDSGPAYPGGFNAGQSVVLPAVISLGARKIDKLIISHADNDHAGGADYILQNIKVVTLETSALDRFTDYHPRLCIGSWQWDGVKFQYFTLMSGRSHNNRSCVLKVTVGSQAVLLPGDIERGTEKDLIHQSIPLAADIVIAPHHGSKTSSSPGFIEAIAPRYVVFATGAYNRFHFPHPRVMQAYKHAGAELYDTAQVGAMVFTLKGKGQVPPPRVFKP